jgi:hypothetical protein
LESDAAPPSASARDAAPLAPAAADAPQQPGIRPTIRANTTTLDEGAASAAGSASASAAVPAADPTTLPRRASKRLTPAPHARSPHEVPDRASAAAQHRERVSRRNAEQDAKKPPSAPLPAAPQAGEQPAP